MEENTRDERKCLICKTVSKEEKSRDYEEPLRFQCPRCGNYEITGTAASMLESHERDDPYKRAVLSHAVRKMQRGQPWPSVDSKNLDRLLDGTLPTPHEQADNLILYLGAQLERNPGARWNFEYHEAAGVIGALDKHAVLYVAGELEKSGLIEGGLSQGIATVRPTLDGWGRYYELTRATVESNVAFMAMPFNDDLLDRVFRECFKPAVAQTGFQLRRIDEEPSAGLIDNRLRVEIRRSRFMIAELTHNNSGAYWEAGFAEGLNRPVIYTCERVRFEKSGTHFDINHCQTVLWDENDLEDAAESLKATIRATLPDQAIQEDPAK